MGKQIKHIGEVISVSQQRARICIVQASACSACHAKSMCMASESKEKIIDAQILEPLAIGDTCEVLIEQTMGWKAVVLAFVLPFLVMMGTLSLAILFTNEVVSGTLAICVVGIYAVILLCFKDKIQKIFYFTAHKLSN